MAPLIPTDDCSDRPLRADAQRNRQLVLDAARKAFAEHGLGVRLDEIAEIAGVGVATVYRRFKDKDALLSALFREEIATIVGLAEQALTTCEGGTGFRWFFEQTVDVMGEDRGLQQILTGPGDIAEELSALARAEIEPRVTELLRRAQAAGRVRADLVAGDLPIIQVILSAIIDATAQMRPELRHRYARLLLDAVEDDSGRGPLPGPAPTSDEGMLIVESWRPRPRRPGARG